MIKVEIQDPINIFLFSRNTKCIIIQIKCTSTIQFCEIKHTPVEKKCSKISYYLLYEWISIDLRPWEKVNKILAPSNLYFMTLMSLLYIAFPIQPSKAIFLVWWEFNFVDFYFISNSMTRKKYNKHWNGSFVYFISSVIFFPLHILM